MVLQKMSIQRAKVSLASHTDALQGFVRRSLPCLTHRPYASTRGAKVP